ncbi:MAG: ATP-dependent Clp protease ATP-binding subunit [Clostridiales bacterium]|nr:ATP-dependent Clp protease ATP-binding subunit [Clostridiales bacterium]
MQNKFTATAKNTLKQAAGEAGKLGHTYIGTEHLLLAMLGDRDSVAGNILSSRGIFYAPTHELIEELSGVGEKSVVDAGDMTPGLRRVIEASSSVAAKYGHTLIGTEDLLLSLVSERESVAVKLIVAQNVSLGELQNDIIAFFGDMGAEVDTPQGKPMKGGGGSGGTASAVGQYGRDLTTLAICGMLDPIIGREAETERVIQILSRRTKNNPCLIGEPGVGKTAVVEGLASRIAAGAVPDNLADKVVITLDIGAMIAGAKYRGEFEDRLKKVMDEVMKNKNIILFIDEIHTIVGAGAAEGAVDAANILKPVLARGEIQVIGATTIAEYRRHIEKDAALERRFQSVLVSEPDEEQTLAILKGLRPKYENHHHITITDEALSAAVSLSARYIPDRFLPDKAIDLVDEAASKKRIESYGSTPHLMEYENEIKALLEKKENAIHEQKFELAAELRDRAATLEKKYRAEKETIRRERERHREKIGAGDIADVVTAWTGIPVKKLASTEGERLRHLEKLLQERIIGQDDAISAVARAIRRGRVGLGNPARPICSLLFMGPTGVGKTELAKAVADVVFGSAGELIRLDMSEYMEKHSVSKMIGSPPGYVGYDEGGGLTEKIRRRPYSVVLFDEIEKAHPDIFNLLLQILDDGILTDSTGRTASFKNAIIIMTTNIGSPVAGGGGSLGFASVSDENAEKKAAERAERMKRLRESFRPELVNRIDEIIVFDRLSHDDIVAIARMMIREVEGRITALGITAQFDPSVAQMLASCESVKTYGARPLRREISSKIEDAFSLWMLDGKIREGDHVLLFAVDGKIEYLKLETEKSEA